MIKRVCGLVLLAGASLHADDVLLPANASNVGGNGSYFYPLNSEPSSYMMVIGAPELNGKLPIGAEIVGISWRRAGYIAFPSWPSMQANFQMYDVYMATSTVPPGQLNMSMPMANVGNDVKLVRTGPLSFAPGAFPGGNVSPDANPWGQTIHFSDPYTYRGGDLLIMVRHTGNNVGPCGLDWLGSAYAALGGQAIGIDSYSHNANWHTQGNAGFIATRLTYSGACYANCDLTPTHPALNVFDFICFMQRFTLGDDWANCDSSTSDPVLNVNDFTCFINEFVKGCN